MKTMKVILVEPEKEARICEIECSLEAEQKTVEGYIEVIYPFSDEVAIICNDEGKVNALPLNRALYDDTGEIYDIICGTFIVCGLTEDDFCSIPEELIDKYLNLFRSPEMFLKIGEKIVAVKC